MSGNADPTPTRNTAGQQMLHHLLHEMGLIVEDEQQVGRFVLDLYCRDLHLGFEYDGPTHTGYQAEKQDDIRDFWLESEAGIPVFRVKSWQMTAGYRGDLGVGIRDWIIKHSATLAKREKKRDKWPVQATG